MDKFINQMEPWFDEAEANAVHEYMKSGGWGTEFRKVLLCCCKWNGQSFDRTDGMRCAEG